MVNIASIDVGREEKTTSHEGALEAVSLHSKSEVDKNLPASQSRHVKTEVAPVAAEYLPA